MEKVLEIAAYLMHRYEKEFHNAIDEMKLHKLLYFTQRESIIDNGNPLFAESFQAWRLGPVMVCVRENFSTLHSMQTPEFGLKYTFFDKIFMQYAIKSSISLSDLSHGEYSWRHAREGYGIYDACDKEILLEDIRLDAERIKRRRMFLKRVG